MKFKTDYIRIENLKQFLIPKLKEYHPDDPRHTPYWSKLTKYCIEGLWGNEFGKKRYMPGRLFFYGNFCTILDVNEEENTRVKIKPLIRDIEWERSYNLLEAEGFSGWSNDEDYTSDIAVLDPDSITNKNSKRYLDLHNSDGKLKRYLPARENIRKLHDKIMGLPLYHNECKNIVELGCLHETVQVRMYDGSLKYSKDIKIGDKLMGVDSTPRIVQKLVRGEGLMYDNYTKYGDKYRTTDSHLHVLKKHKVLPKTKKRKNKLKYTEEHYLDTNQILDINKEILKRQYEAVIQGVDYPIKRQIINPYFIGYWLGDGFKREKIVCYNEDDKKYIEPHLINILSDADSIKIKEIKKYKGHLGSKKIYRLNWSRNDLKVKNNYWSNTFRNNKHIPIEYLQGDKEQRLQLLAGMIDADGSYERGRYRIWNCDFNLIKQFQELARSLGFKAKLHKEQIGGVTNSIKYILSITGNISIVPCIYPRKKAKNTNLQGSDKNHFHVDLDSAKVEPFYGFEVDKDNKFLLADYTVTHNARGGGKSYYYSLAVCKYEICFNGTKYYTEESILKPPKAEVCVGAGQQDKSSDFCKKIKDSMFMLATDNELGVWTKPSDEDYEPSPFFKQMAGSLEPNNKKNPWRHEYELIDKGRKIKEGTGSYIAHVIYSPQKSDGAEAAAGGRYNKLIYEEVGLLKLLLHAWGSNNATVKIGKQFGCQIGLGTSGNMETIKPAKQIFTHPKQYNLLSFVDDWEQSGEIGFFLPAYITNRRFKDENGNTDFEAAIKYYKKEENIAAQADNPHVLAIFKMNNPLKPSDMWQSNKGYLLPVNEAETREKELIKNKLYKKIGTPVKLIWNSKFPRGVQHEIDKTKQPYYEHKYKYTRTALDGPIMIYEFPQEVKGEIPKDMYIFTHDPYKSDRLDEGESLGCTYVIMNPKYIPYGYNGNTIVASYISKCSGGRKEYYENLEKLLQYYGNPHRGLWFENNAGIGDECKNYFVNRNKASLLNLKPQRVQTSNVHQKHIVNYGYVVGNKTAKVELINKLAEWLLELTELSDGVKRNIERIPCRFLIQQIQQFSIESGNYDAVMSTLGFIISIKENEKELMESFQKKENPLSFLSQNQGLFFVSDPFDTFKERNSSLFEEKEKEVVNYNWVDKWNINNKNDEFT
jgi:hypothetical protein